MRRFQNFFSIHNSIFLIFLFSGSVLLAGPEKVDSKPVSKSPLKTFKIVIDP
ncbi:N-acetylmuramoyl-L-alanine amidase, partial [Leptospira kirschneri]